jgi:hypothetical protein
MLEALLRLKSYVREGGKYLLLVFNRLPEYYIPLSERNYLKLFLRHGRDLIRIDFSKEPKTVSNSIRDGKLRQIVQSRKQIDFGLQKYSIEPVVVKGLLIPLPSEVPVKRGKEGLPVIEPEYYFYLIRIMEE